MKSARSVALPLSLGLWLLGVTSCAVRKQVTITNEPLGAIVFLDGVDRRIAEFKDELRFERDRGQTVSPEVGSETRTSCRRSLWSHETEPRTP